MNLEDSPNGVLSEKVRHLKESEKGVGHMCKIMQDFVREEREDAKAEGRAEIAEEMLKDGSFSLEKIVQISHLPLETVKQLAEQISARQ
ncbi:MAG: hypothetical protein II921_02530 [Treponema sp.]|nr:hypothetical protein [Treponema sp.]